jgi:hypothetical protein
LVFVLVFAAIVSGCTNRDKIENRVELDDVYFDYTITADEDAENVTCVFQYKEGDAEGKAMNIEPGKVELDGQLLEADSAKLSGSFYEIQKPLDSFAGKHTVVFIPAKGKSLKNVFEFSPFTLAEELPERISRKPFTIELRNFPATERSVRLLLLDTAFRSSGFNDLVPVVNGKIKIDQFILNTIKKGPINLELFMEQEVSLQQATNAGGRISITYGLRREFELID